MKTLKSLTIAAILATASGLAQAGGVEQYGRGTPDPKAGVSVPSAGANTDVAAVQGRASVIRSAQGGNARLTVFARSVSEVYGRS
ncbi:MAG TPA: hypothetical protein VNM24_09555 [Burkholderiales bacterium]|nr:hypothetical protein [Burkholderiales bacterium]